MFVVDFEVFESAAHLEGLFHASPGDSDVASEFFADVADLLHPVDVGAEHGDEDTAFGRGHDFAKAVGDVAFAH